MGGDWRLGFYDKRGILLDRFKAAFTCGWKRNDYSTAEFSMAISDPQCNERNLRAGNYVLFEHERLGNWGGVIAFKNGISWDSDKTVTVRLLSAEFQFWRRRAPSHDMFSPLGKGLGYIQGSLKDIFRALIRYANSDQDSLVREGVVTDDNRTQIVPLRDNMIGDIVIDHLLGRLMPNSEMDNFVHRPRPDWDFWMEPVLENGMLRFQANLSSSRGKNNGYVLRERTNLVKPSGEWCRLQGELINDIMIAGEGGEALTARIASRNQQSIDKYGLWQGTDTVGANAAEVCRLVGEKIAAEQGEPKRSYLLTAVESRESPDTFAHIGIADTVSVWLDSVRLFGSQRGMRSAGVIESREYNTEANRCILTVKEVSNVIW